MGDKGTSSKNNILDGRVVMLEGVMMSLAIQE